MSGFSDGVSKLWIVRVPRLSLDVEGFKDEHGAIDHLIRCVLTWSEDVEADKTRIQTIVEHALKHMDKADPPDTGDPPPDEEADNNG